MSIIASPDDLSLKPYSLEGQTAVVAGGASGIGRATSKLFASAGAKVVIADMDLPAAEGVVKEIQKRDGKAIAVKCDVSDEPSVKATFAEAKRVFGGVDTLAFLAAYRKKHDTMTMTVADWDIQHAVTTRGTFLCNREAIRAMRESGKGGTIVNVSSTVTLRPLLLWSTDYDSAKSGVNALTRAEAFEFAKDGIRVNAVLPSSTKRPDAKGSPTPGFKLEGPIAQPGRILMDGGRWAEPIEQARAIPISREPGFKLYHRPAPGC